MITTDIDIKKYLPHRYPFLLVDKVISVNSDEIKAIKNVSYNEPYFQGHFPHEPIMPAVLIIESLAQATALHAFTTNDKTPHEGHDVYLTGVSKAAFKHPVRPGDVLTLHAKISASKLSFYRYECRAYVGEKLACSTMITSVHRNRND
tara:strand:+ start:775 stop:1218 length:444 start_codon:yes stop_codon:yes gene_type:complete